MEHEQDPEQDQEEHAKRDLLCAAQRSRAETLHCLRKGQQQRGRILRLGPGSVKQEFSRAAYRYGGEASGRRSSRHEVPYRDQAARGSRYARRATGYSTGVLPANSPQDVTLPSTGGWPWLCPRTGPFVAHFSVSSILCIEHHRGGGVVQLARIVLCSLFAVSSDVQVGHGRFGRCSIRSTAALSGARVARPAHVANRLSGSAGRAARAPDDRSRPVPHE